MTRPEADEHPGQPLEELSDAQLIRQYKYVKAEYSELKTEGPDQTHRPLEELEGELRRRGISPEELPGDLSSPGKEDVAPGPGKDH